jgi:hypothetical protein
MAAQNLLVYFYVLSNVLNLPVLGALSLIVYSLQLHVQVLWLLLNGVNL